MAPTIVTVGEVMLDVLGPAAAGGTTHRPVRVLAGGTAVTAALAVRVAGIQASVIGRIGRDDAGSAIRAALERAGVEALLSVDDELPTGTFVRLGETVVASRGANAHLRPDDVPLLACDAVLVSGYLLGHDDTLEAGQRALASLAPLRAVTATPHLPADFVARARGANVLFANEEEAERLGGVNELTRRFTIVCVTLGAAGAEVYRNGIVTTIAPTGMTGVGAGDAFAGMQLGRLVREHAAEMQAS